MTAPINVLGRPTVGGHLTVGDPSMARSPSAISTTSTTSHNRPILLRRPSSVPGLDYYFSPEAGNGPSSSSSSLTSSASRSKSHMSLKDLYAQASSPTSPTSLVEPLPRPRPPLTSNGSGSYPGPSNRLIHVVGFPSPATEIPSPLSATSESSKYSTDVKSEMMNFIGSTQSTSNQRSVDYRKEVETFGSGEKLWLLDQSSDYGDLESHPSVSSIMSSATYTAVPMEYDVGQDSLLKTPLAPVFNPQNHAIAKDYPSANVNDYHDRSEDATQITPTRATHARRTSTTPTTNYAGRLAFVAPPDVSKRSINALEREVQKSEHPEKMRVEVTGRDEIPMSAPPWQGEFPYDIREEDNVKGKYRATLAALPSSSSSSLVETVWKYEGPSSNGATVESPTTRSREGSKSSLGDNKSPDIPTRSTLRPQNHPSPNPVPTGIPKKVSQQIPTIINTASSPVSSPSRTVDGPQRPSRSPDRLASPPLRSSQTLEDLTEMLGGAIDAIGLVNSRDTPPPTILPPSKDKPSLSNTSSNSLAPPIVTGKASASSTPRREVQTFSSDLAWRSIFPSGLRLGSDIKSLPPWVPLDDPIAEFQRTRPWPRAMMFSFIKCLPDAGERALMYARGTNELNMADSGLKAWCRATLSQAHHHDPIRKPSKVSTHSSLGIRSISTGNPSLLSPEQDYSHSHPRQISSGSEFPMRADATTAREISARLIDPDDHPTSLPANLPFPQLQHQYQSSLKSSISMQNVNVNNSQSNNKKGGFLSSIRKGGGKKESTSLGPPTGSVAKKDIRGLPISAPNTNSNTNTNTKSKSADSPTGGVRMIGSFSTPMGPRGPRGSFTPPPNMDKSITNISGPRGSLDTSLSRITGGGRRSVDGGRIGKGSMPVKNTLSLPLEKEEEVGQMQDILPNADKGVLRLYLSKYGEQMIAIGAYLEDEKRGRLMSA
ncbi:hypothetical protein M231_01291 [Tremella mesenterica]|uniref:Uncharacterized protein n=1 Tax=Tremella mesenterica TaxID=5217 RepID=A0A4Q1BTN4_TREME|nr:hypothetical protein M231_01291 [Tremella mesenterica]